jgi:outer membrane protein OmpA-like peptidoglycan-associated protein
MKKILVIILLFTAGGSILAQSKFDYPIYFAYKVAEMDTTEEKRLGVFLKNFDSFNIDSISIKGYCDDRGKKKINDTLAKKRAEVIYDFVTTQIKYTIPNTMHAFGAVPLEGDLKIDSQRTLNRRAELEIFYSLINKNKKTTNTKPAKKDSIPNLPPKNPEPSAPTIQDFLKSAKIGDVVNLKIYFEGSSSAIKKTSAPELLNLLNFMKENPNRKIKITGHIYDNIAPTKRDAYDAQTNDRNLSKNRAKKVYTFLTNNGIESDRLSYEGMAARFPKNQSPEEDRRVEIEVVE